MIPLMQNSSILIKKSSDEVATLFSLLKLCYKGILQKVAFGRLLPLLLEGDNSKTVGDFPKQNEPSFMEMNRASHFDWNTSLSFSLWSSDEVTKVFTQ